MRPVCSLSPVHGDAAENAGRGCDLSDTKSCPPPLSFLWFYYSISLPHVNAITTAKTATIATTINEKIIIFDDLYVFSFIFSHITAEICR